VVDIFLTCILCSKSVAKDYGSEISRFHTLATVKLSCLTCDYLAYCEGSLNLYNELASETLDTLNRCMDTLNT